MVKFLIFVIILKNRKIFPVLVYLLALYLLMNWATGGFGRKHTSLSHNQIGYLPQQTVVQRDFPASVWEIVLSGFQGRRGFSPFYTAAEKEKTRAAMERLGIKGFEKRCYRELSGGQQQRVLLARALCAAEKVLLLDEPVSGLDPVVTAEMYSLISDLNKKDGVTIIMISHDISVAMQEASHILHIGEEIFFGRREDYLKTHNAFGVKGGKQA